MDMTNLHRSPPMNQSKTDLGIVNESQLLRFGINPDTANARRSALKLETLFGSGPVGSPFVYALDAPNDERRTKLRLGRMRWDEKGVEPSCPFRDIARTPAENVTGIDRSIAGHRVAPTESPPESVDRPRQPPPGPPLRPRKHRRLPTPPACLLRADLLDGAVF